MEWFACCGCCSLFLCRGLGSRHVRVSRQIMMSATQSHVHCEFPPNHITLVYSMQHFISPTSTSRYPYPTTTMVRGVGVMIEEWVLCTGLQNAACRRLLHGVLPLHLRKRKIVAAAADQAKAIAD